MRFLIFLLMVLMLPITVAAQEDKDRITRYLEEALSGLDREVLIEGFQGALSSRVSIDRLSVADDTGVWLTLEDAVLDWSRTAILRGEISIEQISASRIEISRLPAADEEASPEAGSFSLPELPVSIEIGQIAAGEVILGETVIGVPVTLSVNGSLSLADGQGAADLQIERIEGPDGSFRLKSAFSNTSRALMVDLSLREAADGITATLLNLPGKPALELSVMGDAPIDAFTAEVALKSDGQNRLTGQVSTRTENDETQPEIEVAPRVIVVDVAGDLAPLFAPKYRPFFGPDIALQSLIRLFPDGRVTLENLNLKAAAVQVSGNLDLSTDGLPERFHLDARVEDPDKIMVLLPLSGPETRIRRAHLLAGFDASQGQAWTLDADLQEFEREGAAVAIVQVNATGTIECQDTVHVTARIDGVTRGIALADAAVSKALGDALQLGADVEWRKGTPLAINNLMLDADGLTLAGDATIDGLDSAVNVDGTLRATVDDLSRIADLLGQPVVGSIKADLNGQMTVLTGAFDLDLTASGDDLGIGIAKVDGALTGQSTLAVSVLRDAVGLTVRKAKVTAAAGMFETSGQLITDKSNFEFAGMLDDVGRFVDGANGPVDLSGEASQDSTGWLIDAQGTGPFESTVEGQVALPKDAQPLVKLSAVIGAVGAIIPDLPGSAQITATAQQIGESWDIDATGQGPGGSTLAVAGQVRADASRADLDMKGALPLALLNRRLSPNAVQGTAQFDLRLDGPPAVSSLSGQLSTRGTRLSFPELRNALTDLDLVITLSGANADIDLSGTVATGGRVITKGRVGLETPFATDLKIQLVDVTVSDPELYETTADGRLTVTGTIPANLLVAGRVELDDTEIRVPSSGLGGLGGIPQIVHFNEPADVRRTRGHAGLLKRDKQEKSGGGPAIGLDVLIVADSRVFVRGRGLDAELGGRFKLTGTTADIIPVGGLNLIRGRLDILGKRLTLDEGSIQMQGDFTPTLRLVAGRIAEDDTRLGVVIEGRADEPEISFVSEPELPSDEVLSRLLFGREIGTLSALQAVQLASAVATLAGRGGTGVIDRIRQKTGLDDLNVGTDDQGGATLGFGKYISDNIYTDVVIGDSENSQVNLNIDLTRRTKLRGQLESDGGSGIGIFYEKDY